MNIVIDIYW